MKRPIIITAVIFVSAGLACLGEPFVRANTEFLLAVVTLFSVFAGFLVAVMSLGGAPLVESKGKWATLELRRDSQLRE